MIVVEDECRHCGIAYPNHALYRCNRCRNLFCRNCLIYDDEGKFICLRCAKRRLMPIAPQSKYTQLGAYLIRRARYSSFITLSFKFIEEVLGDKLPESAYMNEKWWSNSLNRTPSETWLTVGWKVEHVDLAKKQVSFRKEKSLISEFKEKRRKRNPVSPAFKALALKRRPKNPSAPSKTKIAKTLARYQNIKRRKAMPRTYKGKFKSKKHL